MPSKRELAKRGGLVRVRTVQLSEGRYANVYVVRKKGPKGGHTILGEPKTSKKRRSRG